MFCCSKLKKITAFCAAEGGANIFVGTDSGNIHQVDVSTFRLSSTVICRESITQQYVDIYLLMLCTFPFEQSHLPRWKMRQFLANVNSCSRTWTHVHIRYMSSPVCMSSVCLLSVCNVRAPYLGDWNFPQCFYAIWYLGHPDVLVKILRRLSQGKPSVGGVKHKRGKQI